HFGDDGTIDGFGISLFQSTEDRNGLQVGMKTTKESPRSNLSDQYGVAHCKTTHRLERAIDLTDLDHAVSVLRKLPDQFIRGFPFKADKTTLCTRLTHAVYHEFWVVAPASEHGDPVTCLVAVGEKA